MHLFPPCIFWLSVTAIMYTYGIYSAGIYLASRVFGRSPTATAVADENLPSVTLLIAAHNEQKVIHSRVSNALELDYPKQKLAIVIASDGSIDQTNGIVRTFADPIVRLLDFPFRRGKATTLNDAVSQTTGEILLFSDANTMTDPQAVRALVRWFTDEKIGAVCGRLILKDPVSGKNVDSLYWKYETFLKKQESRLGALLGANGAIYAMRRTRFHAIPGETIIDDFVLPLLAKLKTGCGIIYDRDAIAFEQSAGDISSEFRRRSRIGAGGWQAMALLWPLLNPLRGWIAVTFFSHKVLRWLCPFFMLLCIVDSLLLVRQPVYLVMLCGQLAFYALALIGRKVPKGFPAEKLFRLAWMFVSMNLALLVGCMRWLTAPQTGMWSRTERDASEAAGFWEEKLAADGARMNTDKIRS